ncbi:MAG: dTDP-glucose 4,6-dehydratase [Thermodesulfobacteriota bacterium]
MNLLITGGAGFIGSNFVRYMAGKYPDYRIVNYDNLTYAGNLESLKDVEKRKNYVFVKGDVLDCKLLGETFCKYSIDGVAHLAAESHVDRSIMNPEEFLKTNVMGTHAMLEATRKYWKENPSGGRRVFLNVSTDEVYGSVDDGSFTEDSNYKPNSPYAASKAGADHLVRAYNKTYGLPAITTHCSNNYGPYQFPEKLIPVVILNAAALSPIPVYGEGKNVRDWLYVDDHCKALDVVMHKGVSGETYNIGGTNEWTNIDLVRRICSILDELKPRPAPYSSLIKFVTDRPGHDLRYSIDASKIRRDLGWSPESSFDEALKETVKWYLSSPDWINCVKSGEYAAYYEKNYKER